MATTIPLRVIRRGISGGEPAVVIAPAGAAVTALVLGKLARVGLDIGQADGGSGLVARLEHRGEPVAVFRGASGLVLRCANEVARDDLLALVRELLA